MKSIRPFVLVSLLVLAVPYRRFLRTRALLDLLGSGARVYAVDRDATALAAIDLWPSGVRANVTPVVADLARPFELPGLGDSLLDGALFANTLHFIRDAEDVLARLVSLVKPGGRVVFVEYDRRAPSRWVPYPIPSARLPVLAALLWRYVGGI
jgi:SAM-dependent methyltransferase